MEQNLERAIRLKATELARFVLEMTTGAGSGHPSSALSLAHIVTVLMYQVMRHNPADPWNTAADRMVLSEGHAVPIVYAAWADLGGAIGHSSADSRRMSRDELATLREIDSVLDGHPNPAVGFPFFDAATGSLGQGLSVAAGLGLAARADRTDRRIFVIIGDGESREGQIWEAIDFLADHRLSNVTPVFNANGQGQSDYVSAQQSAERLAEKLRAYGIDAKQVDGHSPADLVEAFSESRGPDGTPLAIVARTQKGWCVDALKDVSNHGKPLAKEKLDEALADLDAELRRIGGATEALSLAPALPVQAPATMAITRKMPAPDFKRLLRGDSFEEKFAATGRLSTRRAYGLALRELGKIDPFVVALDGDVSNSTFSQYFKKAFGDRFFECRIAEQNMVSVAGGLAAAGKIPFASSFGKFLARAYDQIEMCVISRHNLKLAGSHSGASLGADGPSQMGLTDVAFFRSFPSGGDDPAMVVLSPSDAVAAYRAVELAYHHVGPVYIRTARPDVPVIYNAETPFEIGGAHELARGDDVTILASGYAVHLARQALRPLEESGISAGLVDVYSFPIRSELVRALTMDRGRKLLTVEDNYGGGLGSAIAELAAQSHGAKVWRMTVERIPKSGRSGDAVLEWLELGPGHIVVRAQDLVGK